MIYFAYSLQCPDAEVFLTCAAWNLLGCVQEDRTVKPLPSGLGEFISPALVEVTTPGLCETTTSKIRGNCKPIIR